MNGRKAKTFVFEDVLNHIIGLSFFLEILFAVPLNIGAFRFEWPYFSCILLVILMITSNRSNSEKRMIKKPLYTFFIWCIVLVFFSFFRFTSEIYIVGIAHTIRMILLFSPYIWFVFRSNKASRFSFYRTFRVYIFVILIILLGMTISAGGIYNEHSFGTNGVGKNSLGYTIVCISLLLSTYENKEIVEKPIRPFIWLPICILLCIFTKSGTAVIFILTITLWFILKSNKLSKMQNSFIIIVFALLIIPFFNLDFFIEIFDKLHVYKITEFLQGIRDSGGTSLGNNNDVRLDVQKSVFRDFNFDMAVGRVYCYFLAYHKYTAHHLYFQLLYDTGIIGFTLFIIFVFKNIKLSYYKIPIILIFAYSCIEVFLIQYTSLLILGLIIVALPPTTKNDDDNTLTYGSM